MRVGNLAKRTQTKKRPSPKAATVKSNKAWETATGTDDPILQLRLIRQTVDALWRPENLKEDEDRDRMQSAISMLGGIKPADEVEGMLATQMVATHNAAMECLRRAMLRDQTFEGREQNLKHATKLLSIYSRQIEVLNKYRGKGQQKVTVEYVNVESGGQAVVGHVETGRVDGSVREGRKSRSRALRDSPGEIIDLDAKIASPVPQRKS